MRGLFTDTNPTVLAGAAAYAVWNALEFVPSSETVNHLESVIYKSWDKSDDEPVVL